MKVGEIVGVFLKLWRSSRFFYLLVDDLLSNSHTCHRPGHVWLRFKRKIRFNAYNFEPYENKLQKALVHASYSALLAQYFVS